MNARRINPPAALLAAVTFVLAVLVGDLAYNQRAPALIAAAVLLVIVALLIPRVAEDGQPVGARGGAAARQAAGDPRARAVLHRAGHRRRSSSWLDQRIQTTEFNAEQALSKDTVPVNVDAVVFWQIHDPERAALEITDYRPAISRVAQTSLREMVGSSLLSTLLSDRKHGDELLREEIGRKTAEWGVAVISVEIRDIGVPAGLQDAMSREAQAERERPARVHLGQAEQEVAQKFVEAAEIYARSPAALQLRAMNIIYETTKERGATILMPTRHGRRDESRRRSRPRGGGRQGVISAS